MCRSASGRPCSYPCTRGTDANETKETRVEVADKSDASDKSDEPSWKRLVETVQTTFQKNRTAVLVSAAAIAILLFVLIARRFKWFH
jgi:hypothetical protein